MIGRDYEPADDLSEEQRQFLERVRGVTVGVTSDSARLGEHQLAFDRHDTYADYFERNGYVAIVLRPDFTLFGGASSRDQLPALIDELQEQLLAGQRLLANV